MEFIPKKAAVCSLLSFQRRRKETALSLYPVEDGEKFHCRLYSTQIIKLSKNYQKDCCLYYIYIATILNYDTYVALNNDLRSLLA